MWRNEGGVLCVKRDIIVFVCARFSFLVVVSCFLCSHFLCFIKSKRERESECVNMWLGNERVGESTNGY